MQLIAAFIRHPARFRGVLSPPFGVITCGGCRCIPPEVEIPTITIETRWPAASPGSRTEIVQNRRSSSRAKGSPRCRRVHNRRARSPRVPLGSTCKMLLRVNSRLQQVQEYLPDANEPVIRTSNSSNSPIAWFILSSLAVARSDLHSNASTRSLRRNSNRYCRRPTPAWRN